MPATQLLTDASEFVVQALQDPLIEIDQMMIKRREETKRSEQRRAQLVAERSEFWTECASVYEEQIRPAMEAIIDRLRCNGGGGAIVERVEDVSMHRDHRLTLWMSLAGEISGTLRADRLPYLQLDADVEKRSVVVSEGDMWEGHGGKRSGKIGEWKLADITSTLVTDEALAILRRSFG
ncbi:MAG: hypothetical protein WAM97_08300 [Acidimicrobiales bacterium]